MGGLFLHQSVYAHPKTTFVIAGVKDREMVLHASLRQSTWRDVKMSSYFTHSHFDNHWLQPSSFYTKIDRMNVGSDRLHFTQQEEGRVGVRESPQQGMFIPISGILS